MAVDAFLVYIHLFISTQKYWNFFSKPSEHDYDEQCCAEIAKFRIDAILHVPLYCNWISQIQLDLSWKYLASKILKLLKGVQLICCSYTQETKLYTFDIVWFPNSNSDRLVWHLNCKNVYIYKMSVLRPIVICI